MDRSSIDSALRKKGFRIDDSRDRRILQRKVRVIPGQISYLPKHDKLDRVRHQTRHTEKSFNLL